MCDVTVTMDELRVAFKFCVKAGVKVCSETLQIIRNVCGCSALSHTHIHQWYTCFCESKVDVKDSARSSRPFTEGMDQKS